MPICSLLSGTGNQSLLVGSCELTSIHAGVLADSTRGNYGSNTIYDNANPDQIKMLPDTQIHRNIKLDLAGYSSVPLSCSAIMPPLVESHKCVSPSENSVTAPLTKLGVTHKKPTYKIPTPASVKKLCYYS